MLIYVFHKYIAIEYITFKSKRKKKENLIEATILNAINDLVKIKATPGSFKSSATLFVPFMNNFRVQLHRLTRIKPPVTSRYPKNLTHTVKLPQPHYQLPDHRVHTGAQPPARDYGRPNPTRVEVNLLPRPGPVVRQVGPRSRGFVGDVVEDVAEDDVGATDVESGYGAKERVVV